MSKLITESEYGKRIDVISLNFYIIKEFYKNIEGNRVTDLYKEFKITRNGFIDIIRLRYVTRLLKITEYNNRNVSTYTIDPKNKVFDLNELTGMSIEVFSGEYELIKLLHNYKEGLDKISFEYPDEYKESVPAIVNAIESYKKKEIIDLNPRNQLDCLYYYCKEKIGLNKPNTKLKALQKLIGEKITDHDYIECKDVNLLKSLDESLQKTLNKVRATVKYREMENSSHKN